jgi:hypothetical protein
MIMFNIRIFSTAMLTGSILMVCYYNNTTLQYYNHIQYPCLFNGDYARRWYLNVMILQLCYALMFNVDMGSFVKNNFLC